MEINDETSLIIEGKFTTKNCYTVIVFVKLNVFFIIQQVELSIKTTKIF